MPSVPPKKRSSQRFKQTKRFQLAARALGMRVRELRERQSFTLEQASTQTEVALNHLQKVEAGELNVTLVTLLRIADGLGASPSALFEAVATVKRRKRE